jgi:acetyl-CoA carboxylase biotin carboxyl carrier protein
MSDDHTEQLEALCREASALVARLPGRVLRLRLRSGDAHVDIEWEKAPKPGPPATSAVGAAAGEAAMPADTAAVADAVADDRHTVKAVLVGTFYRAPEPGAAPFVEVGDVVEEGQDVAIIEAMKVMNRIQADQAGRVTEFLVNDGEMVEFDQPLIVIEPLEG